MRGALFGVALAMLAGCASMEGQFENRIACTAASDQALVVSMWGRWIGIASVIAERDRPAVCPMLAR